MILRYLNKLKNLVSSSSQSHAIDTKANVCSVTVRVYVWFMSVPISFPEFFVADKSSLIGTVWSGCKAVTVYFFLEGKKPILCSHSRKGHFHV